VQGKARQSVQRRPYFKKKGYNLISANDGFLPKDQGGFGRSVPGRTVTEETGMIGSSLEDEEGLGGGPSSKRNSGGYLSWL